MQGKILIETKKQSESACRLAIFYAPVSLIFLNDVCVYKVYCYNLFTRINYTVPTEEPNAKSKTICKISCKSELYCFERKNTLPGAVSLATALLETITLSVKVGLGGKLELTRIGGLV